MIPVLLYGCEAWTLKSDLGDISMPLAPLAPSAQWSIAGMTMPKQQLLHETGVRPVTSLVHDAWTCGSFPDVDPADRVVSLKDNQE